MGCASSASAANGSDAKGPDTKNTAQKQRRKLSVAPGHVGDITADAIAEAVRDEQAEIVLTDLEKEAKGSLEHSILSRKGFIPYNKKKYNQDRHVLKYAIGDNKDVSLFGVMDGHGEFGHGVSQFVQDNLPVYLGKMVNEIIAEPEKYIEIAVMDMCKKLKTDEINCSFSGTTCVFGILLAQKEFYVANIGDSRCVMAQKVDGGKVKAKDLSEDHKPESPGEKERIIAAGGRVETLPGPPGEDCGPFRVWLHEVDVPGLAMSRSIGDEISQSVGVISNPEIRHHTIVPEDMFCVFASDGVWEFISSQEAIDLVWAHKDDLKQAALVLVDEATKRWKDEEEVIDDITCTIMQFNPFE